MKNKKISFVLNNSVINTEVNPSLPLLDFIRKEKHLTGTKEVCKEGDCGACTVLMGSLEGDKIIYKTITSCIYPIGNCQSKHIVTIEGINKPDLLLHQKIFLEENASQCGFCTPGFLISITCYLLNNEKYEIEKAVNAIAGNICRCTGYHSIERALQKIINELKSNDHKDIIEYLIQKNIIPDYFKDVKNKVKNLNPNPENGKNISKIFIAGGSDLFVQKADELLEVEADFIKDKNLNFIRKVDNKIEIGSGVTFEEIKQSQLINNYLPSLKNDINLIASLPVRNAATLGGNLSNASPIGDLTIIMLALNAQLILVNGSFEREIYLSDFYLDYKKINKENDEFIKSVNITIPKNHFRFSFEKVSKRTYLDIASVNSAMIIEDNDDKIISIRLSAGGIAPIPKVLEKTNQFLINKKIEINNILEALTIMQNELSPISDIRGSAEYKRLLLAQLIKAHFLKLFPDKLKVSELL